MCLGSDHQHTTVLETNYQPIAQAGCDSHPGNALNLTASHRRLKKQCQTMHFQEIINGKPSSRHPDPIPAQSTHSHQSKPRRESVSDDRCDEDDKDLQELDEQGDKQEMVMKLTFDDNGEGISEEIHTSLTRALSKNETQLCSNTRCVNQTNSLIQELQHALWMERRLEERIQYLHHIANINLDLLSVCVDEKKNPVVRVELNKVYKLIKAILEVHSLFASKFNYDNDDGEGDSRNRGVLETNQSGKDRANLDTKGEKGKATRFSKRRKKQRSDNPKPVEDSDLQDVDSIMNVVNSCEFKTIEDADSTSGSKDKNFGPVDSSNVIPLLDFKDIPMLNVTNLPRGLSLVNNTPVINLNTENGSVVPSSSSSSSPTGNNSSMPNVTTASSNNSSNNFDHAPMAKSSNIPILNGPLLNFVNKITSPKGRTRPQPKRKRRIVKKRLESDDGDDEEEDGDFGGLVISNVDVSPPVENKKPKITTKTTRRTANLTKLDDNKSSRSRRSGGSSSSKNKGRIRDGTKIINQVKPRPLKKREDPCRGVTASRVMCEVCGKLIACSSTKSWHFQSHMRKFHTGEKPERCEICDKRFHDSAALRSHMQYIHSQGRPHQCAVCGKSFKSRENLRKHGLVHNTEGTVYHCPTCNKRFKRSDCLKNHQRIFHKRKSDTDAEPATLRPASPPLSLPPPPPPLSSSLTSSSSSSLTSLSSHPVSSTSHPLPPDAHAYPPSSSSYIHTPHPSHETSHDIPWDGRAVPIPPVHMYPLPGMHGTASHMDFPPPWHPLK